MKKIQWHDSFSVGIKKIDNQHKQLFSLLNELIVASETGQEAEVLGRVLDDLVSYTDYHFKAEEPFFKIHPQQKKHVSIHRGFIEKAEQMVSIFHEGDEHAGEETIEYLKNWILNHVLKTDMNYFRDLGFIDKDNRVRLEELPQTKSRQIKILLVEDNEVERRLLRQLLEETGYKIVEAENGVKALELCEKNTDIRIVVTDVKMPIMDGFSLIKAIRKKQLRYKYILVVSGLGDKSDVIKALNLGANDYLTKPVYLEELKLRIQRARQLLRLESQDELIFSMARLSDYRSHETGLHLERTREYVLMLGRHLAEHYPETGLTNQLAGEISLVCPLHDIGKVGIPDAILGKPGKLTDEEFENMKEHAEIGGNLLSEIYIKTGSQTMRLAFEIAMYHHERWDGNGYPAGLSGDGIPIAARIMALADVYDALTSDRVYKKAFSHEQAKKIILEGKNKHFDPRLVETFLVLEDQFIQLKEKLAD